MPPKIITDVLLKNKANVAIANNRGQTPLSLAETIWDIKKLLSCFAIMRPSIELHNNSAGMPVEPQWFFYESVSAFLICVK